MTGQLPAVCGLEAAELVDASVEEAGGGGAGSFDGADGLGFGFVEEGVGIGVVGEFGFGGGTAAEIARRPR